MSQSPVGLPGRGAERSGLNADSDEVARAFRDDVARYSDMMPPGFGASLADNFCIGGRVNPWTLCSPRAPQAVAGEIDAVRVVDEAIQNGVGIGGIADQVMPFVDGDLAGDDGRSSAIAFFEDFEKIVASGSVERFKAPIVEDQQLDAAERAQDAGITTVAAGEREVGEELGRALIEDRAVVTAGLVAKR